MRALRCAVAAAVLHVSVPAAQASDELEQHVWSTFKTFCLAHIPSFDNAMAAAKASQFKLLTRNSSPGFDKAVWDIWGGTHSSVKLTVQRVSPYWTDHFDCEIRAQDFIAKSDYIEQNVLSELPDCIG